MEAISPNLNALTRALGNLVHNDLLNDERLSNIQPQFEQSSGLFYFTAQNVDKQQVVYIPLPHSKDIDFQQINTLQKKMNYCFTYMAIADNTGNILYYQVSDGFNEKENQTIII